MGDKKAQRWARRALSTPRAKVFLSSSKYSLSLGDFGAAGATTAIASVGQMAHHTTSMSAGGGITGKVDVSARFGVARPLDTHTLTCGSSPPLCAIAGSELSFSRWLFAFSLVTTLFFTCEFYLALYGTPLRFELLGRGGGRLALIFLIFSQRWLRLFCYCRGLRLWCEFVCSLAGGTFCLFSLSLVGRWNADDRHFFAWSSRLGFCRGLTVVVVVVVGWTATRRLECAFSTGVWDQQAAEHDAAARLLCAYAQTE
jgi:hypothetical protein